MGRVISESTGLIFTKFSCLIELRNCIIIVNPFYDRSRDVAMATNFRGTISKLADLPSFVALAFWNRLEYRNANKSAMNLVYIVHKFGEIWLCNSGVYKAQSRFCFSTVYYYCFTTVH